VVAGKPTTLTEVTDNVGNPNNAIVPVTNGGSTNDTTPTFKGTGTPGEVVTIKDGDKVVGSTTVNPDGTWNFTTPEQTNGPHSYTASTPSGGSTAPFNVTVDATTPTIIVSANKANLANGETATLTFTLSEASKDFLAEDITTTGGVVTNLQGVPGTGAASTGFTQYTASFTPNAGVTSESVRVSSDQFSDGAGNLNKDGGDADNAVSMTVATANGTISISNATDNVGNPSNGTVDLANGSHTNDNTPTLNGTAPAGSVVTIRDGNTVLGSVTTGTNGTWSFTPATLSEGSHSFNASYTAGGSTNTSNPFTVVVDTLVPTIQVTADKTNLANIGDTATVTFELSEPSLDFTNGDITLTGGTLSALQGVPGTGNAATGFTRYSATFTKTTSDNATVSVASNTFSDAASNFNQDGAEANNRWSFNGTNPSKPTTLTEVTDNVGNPGGGTVPLTNGGSTNDTTPAFKGTGTPGEVVTIKDGDKVVGSTTVNPDGTWNFTAPEQTNGAHSYTASTPSGGSTAPFNVIVDTTLPTIAVSIDKANIGSTETATVTFTLSEASTDFIKDDITVTGGTLGPLVQSNSNPLVYTATFTPAAGAAAGAIGTVKVDSNKFTDAAGNANQDGLDANNSVSTTVVAGKPTTLTEVTDNVGNPNNGTVPVTNGGTTNDTTPAFKGTGTPGEVVTIKDGDKVVGSTTVNPDGTWNFTAPEQATGAHSYTASTPSGGTTAPFTFTIDTTPPTIAVSIDKLGMLVKSSTNALVYTATFTPDGSAANGTVRVDSNKFSDAAGNFNQDGLEANNAASLSITASVGKAAITLAPVTGDNLITAAEGSTLTSVTLTGKVTGAFSAGDVVTLRVHDQVLTTTVDASGNYSQVVSMAALKADADTQVEVSVAAKDPSNGQTSTASNNQNYTVEPTSGTGAALYINPVTADNIVNLAESKAIDTTITGKVTGVFAAGDKVTLMVNDKPYTATLNPDGSFSIPVKTADLLADKDTQIDGTVSVNGGLLYSAQQNYAVDTTAPVATVALNPLTPDNIIDAAEAGLPRLPVTGKVTGEFTPGDKVTVMVDGKPYSSTVKPDGSFSIDVPTGALIADPDTKYEVTVDLTDGAGNPGTASAANDYNSSVLPPANNVAITLNPVTGDNIVTVSDGQADSVTLAGKVSGAFTAGDVVTIRVHDQVLSTTVDAAGNYSQIVSMAAIKADPDTKVEVSVAAKDPVGGKVNTVGTSQDYTVETDGSGGTENNVGKTVALFIDPVTTDNLISATEAQNANTTVTGKVTGKFAAADEVTLTINDKPFKVNVLADGSFSIAIPTADLVADRDTQVDGSVTTSAGTAKAVQNYGLGEGMAANTAIGGTSSGAAIEDSTNQASGSLTVTGAANSADNVLKTPTSLAGTYGNFTLNTTTGAWTYTLDNSKAATQALTAGQEVSDKLTVTSKDGLVSKDISIAITGTNDTAAITGTKTGNVTEDSASQNTATGTLTVADVDTGEAVLRTPASATLAGTYGNFTLNTATGTWVYTLDNSKASTQALAAGQKVTDTLRVTSKDGSANQDIVVTVTGAADASTTVIGGTSTGTAIEDSTAQASGTLSVTGSANSADNVLQTPASLAGTYGNFTLNTTTGAWTYTLDNSKAATQALTQGQQVSDKLTVTSKDASAIKEIIVTVTGVNDAAAITGSKTGSVTEDQLVTTASGALTVSDVDTGEALLATPNTATLAGTYGNFTLNTSTGTWVYTLDNSKAATQTLISGQQVQDKLAVSSKDGTASQEIVVTVNGLNETDTTNGKAAITLAPITGDNLITATEGSTLTNVTLTGKVTGAFTAGDVVTLRVHDQVLTTTVDASGNYSQVVTMAALKADSDTQVEVSVAAKDPASGQTSTATNNQNYTVEPRHGLRALHRPGHC
jgi:VCBS repeat-containing protein